MRVQRRFLLQLASIGSLAGLGHVLANGNKPLPHGIRSPRGEVRVNGAPAHVGQAVLQGDTVSTGAQSEVVYVMANNAYLMRDHSQVSFLMDGAVSVMRIVTGKVLSVFGPGTKRIDTATATVGIRGTACYIEAQDTQVYFCLCYGTAEIRPLADAGQATTLTTRYHDRPITISTDTRSPLLQAAPVLNHRDAELTLLEATVGRVPPFQGGPASSAY